jgi:membrane AbrB-like protein
VGSPHPLAVTGYHGRVLTPSLRRLLSALAIGALGGTLAHLLDVPLAWMLGPLFLVAIAALSGLPVGVPRPLTYVGRALIGMMLGAVIGPDTVERVVHWPSSVALLLAGLAVMIVLVAFYMRFFGGFDRLSAVGAAIPGGLVAIPTLMLRLGGDVPRVTIAHTIRIVTVVMLIPPLFIFWQGLPEGTALRPDVEVSWLGKELWLVGLIPPAWWLARLLRVPAPDILGPMTLAAAASFLGYGFVPPFWLASLTFLVLGASIGARFFGISRTLLLGTGRHALIATLIALLVALGLGHVIHWVTGVPIEVALLAVIPGGVAEMAVLSAALGVDPVFVTFHQVLRNVLLNIVAPFLLPMFVPVGKGTKGGREKGKRGRSDRKKGTE